jgi:hypothetical protein
MVHYSLKLKCVLSFFFTLLTGTAFSQTPPQWISFSTGQITTPPVDPSPEVIISDQGKNGLQVEFHFKGAYLKHENGQIEYSPWPATDYDPWNAVTQTVTFHNIYLPTFNHALTRNYPSWETNKFGYYSIDGIKVPQNYQISSFNYQVLGETAIDFIPFEEISAIRGAPDVLQGPGLLPMGSRVDMSDWGIATKSWPAAGDLISHVSTLNINPVRFTCNRVGGTITRKMIMMKGVKCLYTFAPKALDDVPFAKDLDVYSYKRLVSSGILNMEAKKSWYNPKLLQDGAADIANGVSAYRYGTVLIVSTPAYSAAVADLAEWIMKKGYKVQLRYENTWDRDLVKFACDYYFINSFPKLESVILFGDTKTIPSHENSGDPSDIEYLPYDDIGTGERVPISRIPINKEWVPSATVTDCQNQANDIVAKILSYQKTPPNNINIYSNVTAVSLFTNEQGAMDYDAGGAFEATYRAAQNIKNLWYTSPSRKYTVNEIYDDYCPQPLGTPLYFSSAKDVLVPSSVSFNNGPNDVVNAINAGTGIVWYAGHGLEGGWTSDDCNRPGFEDLFTMDMFSNLTNSSFQPVMFSLCCLSGSYNTQYSFAHKLIGLQNAGASGVFSANISVIGELLRAIPPIIEYNYAPQSPNAALPVGWMINQAKLTAQTGMTQYNMHFHYFGDPTMRMWTKNPHENPITLTSMDAAVVPNRTFNCYYAGVPEYYKKYATATLYSNGALIGVDNGDGKIKADCNGVTVPGTAQLTITAPNCLPLLSVTVPIVEAQSVTYPPLQINRGASDFAVYGSQSVTIGDRDMVYTATLQNYAPVGAGNAANNFATVNVGVSANVGQVECKGAATLRNSCTVWGNVLSPYSPVVQDGYKITGLPIIDPGMEPLAFDLTSAIPVGATDKTIADRITADVAPGSYNNFTVGGSAVVKLHSGVYYASKLDVNTSAKLLFDLTSGPVVFMVRGKINIYSQVVMSGDNGGNVLFVSGLNSSVDNGIYVAPSVTWRGTAVVPNARLQFDSSIEARGALLGKSVVLTPNARLIHVPFTF